MTNMENTPFTDILDRNYACLWPSGRVTYLDGEHDTKSSGTLLLDGHPVLRFGRRAEAWFAGTTMFWITFELEHRTVGYTVVATAAHEVHEYVMRISNPKS